jgi:hypothetical protein
MTARLAFALDLQTITNRGMLFPTSFFGEKSSWPSKSKEA